MVRACRRLIWEIRCIAAPNRCATFRLVDGSRFDYPIKSAIGYGLSMAAFETAEIAFMRGLLQPGDVVFDVGANAGLFTVIAARQVGANGRVYAFEPGQRELELLHHNVSINNLTNITIIPYAISDRNGTAQFAVASDGALSSLGKTNHPEQKIIGWETVQTITLDSFAKDQGIARVDFLKIDVEGAERSVVRGAAAILADNPRLNVLFESDLRNTDCFGYTPQAFLSELVSSGLSVHCLVDEGSHFPISADDPKLGTDIYNFVIVPRQ